MPPHPGPFIPLNHLDMKFNPHFKLFFVSALICLTCTSNTTVSQTTGAGRGQVGSGQVLVLANPCSIASPPASLTLNPGANQLLYPQTSSVIIISHRSHLLQLPIKGRRH